MSQTLTLRQRVNWRRFFHGLGPQPAPHQTHRRNVYILPTRSGVFFAIVLVIMLIGAINYSNNLGYLFTFLLGSVAVVAILHTYRNLLHLEVRAAAVPAVFAGEFASLPVIIDNPGPATRLALEISLPGKTPPVMVDAGTGQTVTELDLYAEQRGRHPLPRFMLATRFPLGLFRAWTHVHLAQSWLVYPGAAKTAPLPPPSTYSLSLSGDQGHGTDDFAGLRNYHPGDSLRHVHWKALARQQVMLTKQFGGDRSDELWLDWELLHGHDLERRLSILTRWIIEAERNSLSYGLRLPGVLIPPGHGPAHHHRCLEKLALYHAPHD